MDKHKSDTPQRVGPEDEDRQSQLDKDKRVKRRLDEDVLKDSERRVREGGVDDTDFGEPRRR